MKSYAILVILFCLPSISNAEYHRNQKAKAIFKYSHPCPSNGRNSGSCPGYIIDHVKALACGGTDSTENMQWQTKEEAKDKGKWERNGC